MPNEIAILHAGTTYETKSFTFPGGELQVQIPGLPEQITGDITVIARLQSADALIRLLLTSEVLCRVHRAGRKRLIVPYFPYSRQDRVMQPTEAFSLKAIARFINSLSFDEVVTCDPHSDVTPGLVENIRIIHQVDLVAEHTALRAIIKGRPNTPVIVSPDAGATKKAMLIARHFGLPLLTASKVRDTETGAITRTEVHAPAPLANADVLIVDDICDGGRTFVELAKVLRLNGAGSVFLYVTHGIFSQGFGVFHGLIDGVFTTDSFHSEHIQYRLPLLHISTLRF